MQAAGAGLVFELKAGEALYIPNGWWHAIEAISPSVSISARGVTLCEGLSFLPYWIRLAARDKPAALLASVASPVVGLLLLILAVAALQRPQQRGAPAAATAATVPPTPLTAAAGNSDNPAAAPPPSSPLSSSVSALGFSPGLKQRVREEREAEIARSVHLAAMSPRNLKLLLREPNRLLEPEAEPEGALAGGPAGEPGAAGPKPRAAGPRPKGPRAESAGPPRRMSVQCPPGAGPGSTIMIQDPTSRQQMDVVVPDGVGPGMLFQVQMGGGLAPMPAIMPVVGPPRQGGGRCGAVLWALAGAAGVVLLSGAVASLGWSGGLWEAMPFPPPAFVVPAPAESAAVVTGGGSGIGAAIVADLAAGAAGGGGGFSLVYAGVRSEEKYTALLASLEPETRSRVRRRPGSPF